VAVSDNVASTVPFSPLSEALTICHCATCLRHFIEAILLIVMMVFLSHGSWHLGIIFTFFLYDHDVSTNCRESFIYMVLQMFSPQPEQLKYIIGHLNREFIDIYHLTSNMII